MPPHTCCYAETPCVGADPGHLLLPPMCSLLPSSTNVILPYGARATMAELSYASPLLAPSVAGFLMYGGALYWLGCFGPRSACCRRRAPRHTFCVSGRHVPSRYTRHPKTPTGRSRPSYRTLCTVHVAVAAHAICSWSPVPAFTHMLLCGARWMQRWQCPGVPFVIFFSHDQDIKAFHI